MISKGILAGVIGILLLVLVKWGTGRLEQNQRADAMAAQALLVRDTVEAAQDTSRALSIEGMLGDAATSSQVSHEGRYPTPSDLAGLDARDDAASDSITGVFNTHRVTRRVD